MDPILLLWLVFFVPQPARHIMTYYDYNILYPPTVIINHLLFARIQAYNPQFIKSVRGSLNTDSWALNFYKILVSPAIAHTHTYIYIYTHSYKQFICVFPFLLHEVDTISLTSWNRYVLVQLITVRVPYVYCHSSSTCWEHPAPLHTDF